MSDKNGSSFITGILIIASFLVGMFANTIINKVAYDAPGEPQDARIINKEVQQALSIDKQLPSVVFSITRDGSMQAFVPEGAKVITPKFPLHADNLLNIDSITVYTTSNPKKCWKSSNGDERCVTW